MRQIAQRIDFVLFSSSYEESLAELEAVLANQQMDPDEFESDPERLGLELTFITLRESRGGGEILFGDGEQRAWSRAVIDALTRENADLGAQDSCRDLQSGAACFRPRAGRTLTSGVAGELYMLLSSLHYCSMFGYTFQVWELESSGQPFALVSADAESG
jgi:hypothetical protein